MSEIDAHERYYWAKIRQAIKGGFMSDALKYLADGQFVGGNDLLARLQRRIAFTFRAGCEALNDPPRERTEHVEEKEAR